MCAFPSVEFKWDMKDSSSHLLLLFGNAPGLLLCLLVAVVDLGVHAVHALGPLPVDHTMLLLTEDTTARS